MVSQSSSDGNPPIVRTASPDASVNGQDHRPETGPPPASRQAVDHRAVCEAQFQSFIRTITNPPVGCVEIRVFDAQRQRGLLVPDTDYPKTYVYWGNDPDKLWHEAQTLRGVSGYIIPNPIDPRFMAKTGQLTKVERSSATADINVLVVRFLYLDFDVNRPPGLSGISSTRDEWASTGARLRRFIGDNTDIAASALCGSSGNGCWLLVRLPDYPNDQHHRDLVAWAVDYLADRYSDDEVKIDRTCKNPARLMPLVGTAKCKGVSTDDRPHRYVTLSTPLDKECPPFDLEAWRTSRLVERPQIADNDQPSPRAKGRSQSQARVDDQVSAKDDKSSHNNSDEKPPHEDDDVVRVAMKSEGFRALWEGHWQGTHPSQSEADEGLASRLAFFCGPGQEKQVRRLFLRSALGERAKADRPDYLPRTVAKAYEGRDKDKYFQWSDRGAYYEQDGKLYFDGKNGPQSLTTFTARIVENITRHSGGETIVRYCIAANHSNSTIGNRTITVDADQYGSMSWVFDLGAEFSISAGSTCKDHVRCAIQRLSTDGVKSVVEHTSLGWIRHSDQWLYVHAAGAIGSDGESDRIRVDIHDTLGKYRLPSPPTDQGVIREAIAAHLGIWDLATDSRPGGCAAAAVVAMLPFRAVVSAFDAAVHFGGPSGNFKTSLARVAYQHFSIDTKDRNAAMPAGWNDTTNAIQRLAFDCRDSLLIVDDLKQDRQVETAEVIFQAQGNLQNRTRMNIDQSLQASLPPRGSLLSTGEIDPRSQSTLGRILLVEIRAGDIDPAVLTRLQESGDQGHFATLMASYIRWLAPRLDGMRARHRRLTDRIRARIGTVKGTHPRHPDIAAQLLAAYLVCLKFAAETGVPTALITGVRRRAWACVRGLLGAQADPQEEAKVGRQFLADIRTALSAKRAHLESALESVGNCNNPGGHERACGWYQDYLYEGKDLGQQLRWRIPANSKRVGFIDVEEGMIYLCPEEAIAVANNEARRQGRTQSFANVGRELLNESLVVPHEEKRGDKTITRATKEKRIHSQGKYRYFWISIKNLFGESDDSDDQAPRAPEDEREPDDSEDQATKDELDLSVPF
jgi:hypothetical protein